MNDDKNIKEEILIVEDSPTQAGMLKFLLEKHKYRVLSPAMAKKL